MIAVAVDDDKDKYICSKCYYKNCDSANPAASKRWRVPGVIESNVCLLPMITPLSSTLLRFLKLYKKNVLPRSGGWLQQPAIFIQAVELIGYE